MSQQAQSTAYPDPRQKEMEGVAVQTLMILESDNSIQTMPLRQYLDSQVVPTLLPALAAVAEERPNNPVEYLAHYLMVNNPRTGKGSKVTTVGSEGGK